MLCCYVGLHRRAECLGLLCAAGRAVALQMAKRARTWQRAASELMPEATGDIREIVGQPVFVPLYKLFLTYGKIFRLSFGPKSFVVISDAAMAKQASYCFVGLSTNSPELAPSRVLWPHAACGAVGQ